MPAPAFSTLLVAIFGAHDEPKVALVFIGTFFQMVLVISKTTRQLDHALLEAAQTLGAKPRPAFYPRRYSRNITGTLQRPENSSGLVLDLDGDRGIDWC